MHLGINQKPIECHGKGAWVLLMISKQLVELVVKSRGDVKNVTIRHHFTTYGIHP
jgi:hypothetical protein